MSIIQRLRGTSDTKTTADFAADILGQFENDPIAAEAVGLAEQKTDGVDVSVDDVVAQMRDESDAFDADFRAEILVDLFGLVDEYAQSSGETRNELAGELVGFLNDAEAYDLLTENGFENAKSAAEAGDVERLQDIVSSDPDLQAAVQDDGVLAQLKEKVEWDVDSLLADTKADADTQTDSMADKDKDEDTKQDEGNGKMNAVALMEQLDAFDSDDVAAVERTAEMTGQPVEEVAGEIVGDMLDLGNGGAGNEEPDMNADDYDEDDEEVSEEDKMSDTDGDAGTDTKSESGDVVTSDQLDSKLSDFEDRLLDSVADAVTADETVAQIGQKLGESDEAREAIADGLMDDVDEKLETDGYVTPSPTQTADGEAGKAADTLLGSDD